MMSSEYWRSMFSLIWLFSSIEKSLSHLVNSGELQGGGLGVAGNVRKVREMLRYWSWKATMSPGFESMNPCFINQSVGRVNYLAHEWEKMIVCSHREVERNRWQVRVKHVFEEFICKNRKPPFSWKFTCFWKLYIYSVFCCCFLHQFDWYYWDCTLLLQRSWDIGRKWGGRVMGKGDENSMRKTRDNWTPKDVTSRPILSRLVWKRKEKEGEDLVRLEWKITGIGEQTREEGTKRDELGNITLTHCSP